MASRYAQHCPAAFVIQDLQSGRGHVGSNWNSQTVGLKVIDLALQSVISNLHQIVLDRALGVMRNLSATAQRTLPLTCCTTPDTPKLEKSHIFTQSNGAGMRPSTPRREPWHVARGKQRNKLYYTWPESLREKVCYWVGATWNIDKTSRMLLTCVISCGYQKRPLFVKPPVTL